jgi:hypothetical protein
VKERDMKQQLLKNGKRHFNEALQLEAAEKLRG